MYFSLTLPKPKLNESEAYERHCIDSPGKQIQQGLRQYMLLPCCLTNIPPRVCWRDGLKGGIQSPELIQPLALLLRLPLRANCGGVVFFFLSCGHQPTEKQWILKSHVLIWNFKADCLNNLESSIFFVFYIPCFNKYFSFLLRAVTEASAQRLSSY